MLYVFIVVVLIAGLSIFVYHESKGFKVVHYSFVSNKLTTDSYRIAFISDMHNCDLGNGNKEVIDSIIKEKPDSVFLAGDMVTSSMEPTYHVDGALDFIGKLAKLFPIYYGMGNHEEKFKRLPNQFPGVYEDYCSKLSELGLHIMDNEITAIEDAGIVVYGLNLEHKYFRKLKTRWIPDDYLESIFGGVNSEKFSILIAHNPEQFDKYALWKPDLVLSGHVHGGIIGVPLLGGIISPQLKLFPKYDAGEFKINESTMILSRGLGTHTIPVRVFNKAEVIIIDIKRE